MTDAEQKKWFTHSFTEEKEEKSDQKRKRLSLLHVNEAAVENPDTHRPKLSGRDGTSPNIHGRDMTLIPKKIMIEKTQLGLKARKKVVREHRGKNSFSIVLSRARYHR